MKELVMQHIRGISRLSPAAIAAVAIAVGVAPAQPAAAADLPASGTRAGDLARLR
jgi:hypothetical protein